MNKEKTLIKNTAIIAIGSLSTKILTFLLLPLYTAVLATDDYGTIDALMTLGSLFIPFASLEINSGVFRFIIEKNELDEKKTIISTAVATEMVGLFISTICFYIVNLIYPIPHINIFIFYIVSMTLIRLASDTARGFGDNAIYSFSNFIVTLVSLVLNLLFILILGLKGESILLATSIGNTFGIIIILFKERVWKYLSLKKIKRSTFKWMTSYTIPLIPNTVSWWVVSASDRLIILYFLGASVNGIYAAANKIPGIYTTIFSVFSLAWTEAVARNVTDIEFISNTFKRSLNVMTYMLLGIVTCSSLFFNILIGENYSDSYWHILILLFAIFFSSISSLLGGIYAGKMESKSVAQTTLIGAIVNVIVNLAFVRVLGLYAASISTLCSYFFVFILRYFKCREWYDLSLFSSKDIFTGLLLITVMLGYLLRNNLINSMIILIIIAAFVFNNRNELKGILISGVERSKHK